MAIKIPTIVMMLEQESLTEVEDSVWFTFLFLLVHQLLFILKILLTFVTKQATSMRRSTVMGLPRSVSFPWLELRFMHILPSKVGAFWYGHLDTPNIFCCHGSSFGIHEKIFNGGTWLLNL
jgi:hypothetical protein